MSIFAHQLSKAIAELDRRIEKTDAKATRIHGGRKCGKHFWCGGYCDKVRDLVEIKRKQKSELNYALALMAAETFALQGLSDDVLKMIVGCASHEQSASLSSSAAPENAQIN